jgi:hypothetical protein
VNNHRPTGGFVIRASHFASQFLVFWGRGAEMGWIYTPRIKQKQFAPHDFATKHKNQKSRKIQRKNAPFGAFLNG